MNLNNLTKTNKFFLGLLFDGLGYVSFIFPPIDFIWAPASAWLMTKLYEGKKGRIAAVITFVEEALPWFDVIPTFTLMWIYTFVVSKPEKKEDSERIDTP